MTIKLPTNRRIATATQDYPLYPALWHLRAIGLLDGDGQPVLARAEQRAVRVAAIDTSVAADHPCLVDSIDQDRSIDFASSRLGAFPYAKPELPAGLVELGAEAFRAIPYVAELAQRLEARLAAGQPARDRIEPGTGRLFSTHGTATAGLIAARPVIVKRRVPEGIGLAMRVEDQPLPYIGAHPHASLMAISTSFDPDPEQLILALLTSAMLGADVILLARDVPDPRKDARAPSEFLRKTDQVPPTPAEIALWEALEALLVFLSRRVPIICAAGNGNEPGCVYPANLCAPDNGIISVGAVNARGWLTAYSATGAFIHAPSSDGERYDRVETRLDPRAPEDKQPPPPKGRYSPQAIISTDVPGRGGYSGSAYRELALTDPFIIREIGSSFCSFGGTSAASAITCGFLAAGIGAGSLDWPDPGADRGHAAREWLSKHSVVSPVGEALRIIALDGILHLPHG